MADASGIRAGQAYVELGANDSLLRKVLDRSAARLKAWGDGIAAVGSRLALVGGAFMAGFGAAAKAGAESNLEFSRTAARLGTSVEALSAVGYAADLSGVDMETLAKSVGKMQQSMAHAADGSKTAQQAFAMLGTSAQDLSALPLDKQMLKLAEGFGKVENPARRTQLAMELMGKGGAAMLPLLAQGGEGVQRLFQEAQQLGRIKTTESVRQSAELALALKRLEGAVKAPVRILAGVLAPMLTEQAKRYTAVASAVAGFVKEHKALAAPLFTAVTALGTAGTGLALFGTLLGRASVAVAFLGKPIGLLTAGLGLLGAGATRAGGLVGGALAGALTLATGAFSGLLSVGKVVLAGLALLATPLALKIALIAAAIAGAVALGRAAAGMFSGAAPEAAAGGGGEGPGAAGPGQGAGAWDRVKDAAGRAWETVRDSRAGQFLAGVWDTVKTKGAQAWAAVSSSAVAAWQSVKGTAIKAADGIGAALSAGRWDLAFNVAVAAIQLEWTKLVGWLKDRWSDWTDFWGESLASGKGLAADAWAGLQAAWVNVTSFLIGDWEGFLDSISKGWDNLTGFLTKAWEGITSAIAMEWELFVKGWEGGVAFVRETWDAVTGALSGAWQSVTGYLSSAWEVFSTAFADQVAVIRQAWDALVERFEAAIGPIKKVLGTVQEAAGKVASVAGAAVPGLALVGGAVNIAQGRGIMGADPEEVQRQKEDRLKGVEDARAARQQGIDQQREQDRADRASARSEREAEAEARRQAAQEAFDAAVQAAKDAQKEAQEKGKGPAGVENIPAGLTAAQSKVDVAGTFNALVASQMGPKTLTTDQQQLEELKGIRRGVEKMGEMGPAVS